MTGYFLKRKEAVILARTEENREAVDSEDDEYTEFRENNPEATLTLPQYRIALEQQKLAI